MLGKLADRISYFYMIRQCWRLSSRAERRRMFYIYALFACTQATSLSRPIIVGHLVATLAKAGPQFLPHLLFWLAMLAGSTMLFWAFNGPARIAEQNLARDLKQHFIISLYGCVTRLPWNWHQQQHSGDTLARMNTAARELYNFANNQFWYVQMFTYLIGSTILLLWIAPIIGILIAVVAPCLYLVIRYFDQRLVVLAEAQNTAESSAAGVLSDLIGNIASLITLRLASRSLATFSARFPAIREIAHRNTVLQIRKWAAFTIGIEVAGAIALLFYLLDQADVQGAVVAGTIVSVFQYLELINSGLQGIAQGNQYLMEYRVALNGVSALQQEAARMPDLDAGRNAMDWTKLSVSGVRFRYEDREHHLHQLEEVGLVLARGRRIALVGSSGSGKSTLLRLLRGLHEPAEGILEIDGLAQPDFTALARVSTLILQDAELFENTLRYNIAFGAEAGDAELQPVIDMACLAPVIDPLPQKLDTDIRERGVNLSGGQKQRLALARGLFAARGSSLLLMDEPTSSLDPITEAEVFTRIFAGLPDTCIVAAIHRLHLLDRFNHIYVMENGRVVEEGTLADLLALDGTLAKLWAAQKREEDA